MRMTRAYDEDMLNTLRRSLDWLCARRCVNTPDGLVAVSSPDVQATEDRIVLVHHHLNGTASAVTGIDADDAWEDDGSPSATFHHMAVTAIRDVRRRAARMVDLAAVGDGSPIVHDDRGRPGRGVPGWAYLIHPLLAYGIARHALGMEDDSVGPDGEPVPPPARPFSAADRTLWTGAAPAGKLIQVHQDLVQGTLILGPRTSGLRIMCMTQSLYVEPVQPLPDTIVQALIRQPLSRLVDLPPCGLDDIDQAVSTLRITDLISTEPRPGAADNPDFDPFLDKPRLAIGPVPWLRAGPDPDGFAPTWNTDHPHVA